MKLTETKIDLCLSSAYRLTGDSVRWAGARWRPYTYKGVSQGGPAGQVVLKLGVQYTVQYST